MTESTEPAPMVTQAMINAGHDVTLKTGDIILSARLLEAIYLAMCRAAPK